MTQAAPKKHHRSIILSIIIVIFVISICSAFVKIQLKINDKKEEAASLSQEYENLLLANEEMSSMLAAGNEAEIIERIAREDRGYVYPDEDAYFDATP